MASGHDAQIAGEKIEALLDKLRSNAGPQVAETAEELVSCLVELYGDGLAEEVLRPWLARHRAGRPAFAPAAPIRAGAPSRSN